MDIRDIIKQYNLNKPYTSREKLNTFLAGLDVNDQAALISALYIGRDHIHVTHIQTDYFKNFPCNRHYITGDSNNWLINPTKFNQILFEKGLNVETYLNAFMLCTNNSGYDLSVF